MSIRVSCRRVGRSLVVALLAACPLMAADPPQPVVVSGGGYYYGGPQVGPVRGASYVGPKLDVEIPPVPLGQYPALYSGFDWGRVSNELAAVKKRNAERVPFELKYLPPPDPDYSGPQVIFAARPSAIFDRPGGQRLVAEYLVNTGILDFAKGFYGLTGVNFPAIHGIDMLVTRVKFHAKLIDNDTKFDVGGFATGIVIRTRERFDWRRELACAKPALGTATYRGVEYRTTKVNTKLYFPQSKDEDTTLTGLYVADDHTLVIETEDAIERLIDRLLDAQPAPEPAGWGKVSRGVCAAALSSSNKAWTHDLPGSYGPRLPKGGDWEWNVLDDLHELLIGLDDQPTTRLYLSANAFDPFAGNRMAWNAKRLLALAAAYLVDAKGPEGEQVRAVWQKATFTPTFRGFQITADTGSDLLNPLLDGLAAKATPALPRRSGDTLLRSLSSNAGAQAPTLQPPEGYFPGRVVPGSEKKSESDLPPIPPPLPPGSYGRAPPRGAGGLPRQPGGF